MRLARLFAILAVASSLTVSPAVAGSDELRLPEKLDEAFRDMMDRMKPALEDLFDTMQVFEDIDGLENYERPEILPNGDIIIRRREDAPPWPPLDETPLKSDPEPGVRT